MKNFRRGALLCLLLVATAGCDRVTKHLAVTTLAGTSGHSYLGDTVRLDYQENPGGFLSAGADWRPETRAVVFQIANGIFLLGTLLMAFRYQWSRWAAVGLMLFIAGGVSNWIDRVAMGTVIDFMNVGIGSFRTGIFNVADVAIMAGITLLIADRWLPDRVRTRSRAA
jgi:signal peptidase II